MKKRTKKITSNPSGHQRTDRVLMESQEGPQLSLQLQFWQKRTHLAQKPDLHL